MLPAEHSEVAESLEQIFHEDPLKGSSNLLALTNPAAAKFLERICRLGYFFQRNTNPLEAMCNDSQCIFKWSKKLLGTFDALITAIEKAQSQSRDKHSVCIGF